MRGAKSDFSSLVLQKIRFPAILWTIILIFFVTAVGGTMAAVNIDSLEKSIVLPKKALIQKAVKLQLPFLVNKGQIKDSSVQYYARTFAGNVYITNQGEVIYQFQDSPAKSASGSPKPPKIWLLKEKGQTPDQIRQKCRNEVNDVRQCSLSKVIKLAQDKMTEEKIYKVCGKK